MLDERDARRAWPARPVEGWLSLVALLAMLLILGFAVDDARWAGWVPGTQVSQTRFLPLCLVLGAGWGFSGAKLRWHGLLVHATGALLGAACAILVVAGTIPAVHGVTVPPSDPFRLANLVASVQLFLRDVLVRQVRSDQTSAFLLVVATVGWASGQFAAFAVYRHHRPMSAVIFLGLLLLASMALTLRHQYPYLILYAAAALFLLVRVSLAEQGVLWSHARVSDAAAAASLYLRNGVTFITVALGGAVLLTATASSAPLRPLWTNSADQFAAWATQFDRLASGVAAPIRGPSGLFGASETIQGFWQGSPALAYEIRTSDGQGYYWRAATYDEFDGHTWKQSDRTTSAPVAAGQPVLAGSSDQVTPGRGYRRVTVTVAPVDTAEPTILAPETPYAVSLPVQVDTAAPGGPLDAIRLTTPLGEGGSYQVTALVRTDGGQVTANELAAAGTVYPAWARRYIAIEPGSIGPLVQQQAERIVASLPAAARDPYHVAQALQDWLYRGGNFIYDTDVQGACAPGTPVPDCLLISRRGYCEYFATTLVMMLRTQQIPARYVLGYLPGRPVGQGRFQVDLAAAHAWVEVYFPHYGWVRFDPTPGNAANGQRPTDLPAGPPVPAASAGPGAGATPHLGPTFVPDAGANGGNPRRRLPNEGQAGGGSAGGAGDAGIVGPLASGLLGLAMLLVLWTKLGWGATANPTRAYNGVARLASRFGYAPRPAQTVYEYAAMLGNLLPAARPDLEVVAHARVEATYGRRTLGTIRAAAVRRAYGRLRVRLLALALRWGRRR